MSVAEIVNELTALAYRLDSMRSHQATTEGLKTTAVLREAAAILSTHPDAKPNDPLTLEELREMDGEPVWISSKASQYGSYWLVSVCGDLISFRNRGGYSFTLEEIMRWGDRIYRTREEGCPMVRPFPRRLEGEQNDQTV